MGIETDLSRLMLLWSAKLDKHIITMKDMRNQLFDLDSSSENVNDSVRDMFASISSVGSNGSCTSTVKDSVGTYSLEDRYLPLLKGFDPLSPLYEAFQIFKKQVLPLAILKEVDAGRRKKVATEVLRLAALLWQSGETVLSLECMSLLTQLGPSMVDSTGFVLLLRLCWQNGLWHTVDVVSRSLLARLSNANKNGTKRGSDFLPDYLTLVRIAAEFFQSDQNDRRENQKVVKALYEQTNDILEKANKMPRSFPAYRLLALTYELMADICSGDYRGEDASLSGGALTLKWLECSCRKWRTLIRSQVGQSTFTESATVINYEQKNDGTSLFLFSLDISGYFKNLLRLAEEYTNCGLPRDAQGVLVEAYSFSSRLGFPIWMMRISANISRLYSLFVDAQQTTTVDVTTALESLMEDCSLEKDFVDVRRESRDSDSCVFVDDTPKSSHTRRPITRSTSRTDASTDVGAHTCSISSTTSSQLLKPRTTRSATCLTTSSNKSFRHSVTEAKRPHLVAKNQLSGGCTCFICSIHPDVSLTLQRERKLAALLMRFADDSFDVTEFTHFINKCNVKERTMAENAGRVLVRFTVVKFKESTSSPIYDRYCSGIEDESKHLFLCLLLRRTERLLCVKRNWSSAVSVCEAALAQLDKVPLCQLVNYRLLFRIYMAVARLRSGGFNVAGEIRDEGDDVMDLEGRMGSLSIKPERRSTKVSKKQDVADQVYAEIKNDFDRHSMLLYYPWRRLIGELLAEIDYSKQRFTESAFGFAEAYAVALRQRTRGGEFDVPSRGDDNLKHEVSSLNPLCHFANAAEMTDKINSLPKDWTVLLLHATSACLGDPLLWMVRLRPHMPPIILPLIRLNRQKDSAGVLAMLAAIMVDNEDSVKSTDAKEFWQLRFAVDARLKDLLAEVETKWLSSAKYLLLGCANSKRPENSATFRSRLQRCGWNSHQIEVLETVALVAHKCEIGPFIRCLDTTGDRTKTNEHLLQATESAMNTHRLHIDFGLTDTQDHDVTRYSPTILIPSKEVCQLPWECLPVLNGKRLQQPVSRVHSIHFLIDAVQQLKLVPKSIDSKNAFYIVDPTSTLEKTKQTVTPVFESQFGWTGLVGDVPSASTIRQVLENNDLLLYCGHGSGTRYYGSAAIRESRCRAVALMIGCNSARVTDPVVHATASRNGGNGRNTSTSIDVQPPTRFEPRGTVHEFGLAMCPCYVGCLWMVTDRDIDGYLLALLEAWLNIQREEVASNKKKRQRMDQTSDLLLAMSWARSSCRLPYLTGAATVAYGLPVVAAAALQ